ncbi:MAG TPA: threonine synthase [Planctomycetaceae bacterium]|nr:threonine synthase [Planctomycetaceae bacterium]
MHTSLKCAACGRVHAIDRLQNVCEACGRPLLAGYPLDKLAATFTPDVIRGRTERSLWKFAEVLPIDRRDEAISLGEGLTPLLSVRGRGPLADFRRLFVKDESLNPTGSFKARGMSAAITRAKALGAKTVALPSAGNAGGAAAAYAARAGLTCHVLMPEDTPTANVVEAVVAGAHVGLVKGLISDCGKLIRKACDQFGWFDLSTLKEPFRVEGKKTMGYELAFDCADEATGQLALPDVILYPAGGGTGLIGMWKAFEEMERLGWIGSQRPRMVAVQAENCAPIVRAFEQGQPHAETFPNAQTVASGLRVPAAIGDFLMLTAIRASEGTAIAVSDRELLESTQEMSRALGNFVCPEAGAVWAAARRLADQKWIKPEERIVLYNTGTGFKYLHLFPLDNLVPRGDLPLLDPARPDAFDAWQGKIAACQFSTT